MKVLYRLLEVDGQCSNCNFDLGGVSYLVDPPSEPHSFAQQNGALCAECALQLLVEINTPTVEEEAVVLIRTL